MNFCRIRRCIRGIGPQEWEYFEIPEGYSFDSFVDNWAIREICSFDAEPVSEPPIEWFQEQITRNEATIRALQDKIEDYRKEISWHLDPTK